MLRVIIEVARDEEDQTVDLEVPADVPAIELARVIAEALEWSDPDPNSQTRYQVSVQSLGRALRDDESLAQAEVWDGSQLVFQRALDKAAATARAAYFLADSGREYDLTPPEMTIGRRWSGEVSPGWYEQLVDMGDEPSGQTVSRVHARVLFNGNWILAPVPETTNPTLVNGILAKPNRTYVLAEGDVVQVGDVKLQFHWRS